MKAFRRRLRWAFRLFLVVMIADLIYVATLWPDWNRLAKGPIPRSSFITQYDLERKENAWPPPRWQPIAFNKIPHHMARAVIIAEDARFYTHSGFDLAAIREAWDHNLAEGRLAVGGSTISQQTVKNLFLTGERTPWRKWHEALLTLGMEHHLSKQRILDIYLNIAEFGRGIYGVEAAARAYWGIPAEQLSVEQAAELAATLPGPTRNNPATRTKAFERRSKKILAWLGREFAPPGATVPTRGNSVAPPPNENGAI